MAKKEKPNAGRFIHIDFPPEGINPIFDALFRLSFSQALILELHTHSKVKVSYTGMPELSEEELSKDNGLRLVK